MKRMIALISFLILYLGLELAHTQQLYISDIGVRYKTAAANGYCNDVVFGDLDVDFITTGGGTWAESSLIEFEQPQANPNTYPGGCLGLCVRIQCVSTVAAFGVDELSFEIFKFQSGSNPLDPASTPPIRTVSLYNIGTCDGGPSFPNAVTVSTECTAWDGSYNLNGEFGKTNGQFGYRATVKTNQVSQQAGNIIIQQTSAFPGENQIPIQINVTNIHMVRSSPTVVGRITGVGAQPINVLYRLSQAATSQLRIYSTGASPQLIRSIAANFPRYSEVEPDGSLTNGDFWDGRNNTGDMMPSGVYRLTLDAFAYDLRGLDNAYQVDRLVAFDPLQITDIGIKPLEQSATDVAAVSFMLTEPATVYLRIYTPGTNFTDINTAPPVLGSGTLLREIRETKMGRTNETFYWDGRDTSGNPVCDGDYVYALWAEMPSLAVAGGVIRTLKTYTGVVPVSRGLVIGFVSPSSTVIGSSPSVAGLDPFYFKYTPSRDAIVSVNIRNMQNQIVRRVVTDEVRFANFTNKEMWDGKDDNGKYVSSGTYLVELMATDPFQCGALRVSTNTALIPVHLFRIVDVRTKPLMGSTSDYATVSFNLSQTMWVDLKIYDPKITYNSELFGDVSVSSWPWTSGKYIANSGIGYDPIVYGVSGVRPGRYTITEYWDGRDKNGYMVPDARYPFTLVAYSTDTANVMYATDKAYGYVDMARGKIVFTHFEVIPTIPQMYSSSDTLKLPPYQVEYSLTRQSSVTVQVMTLEIPAKVVANVVSGQIRDGDMIYSDFWDGRYDEGDIVPGGAYNVRITAQDITTKFSDMATVQMTIDVYPLRIYDLAISPLTPDSPAVVYYQVSETMKVVTKIYKPGTRFSGGMPYPPESSSLVKRIIGVRPARTQIMEYWDGTDLTLSKVPDGNYIFRIYASTSTNAINSVTGEYNQATTVLADDIPLANVSATQSGNTCGDFAKDSWFAPNPYEGTSGFFKIALPTVGITSIKIYGLAGDLVLSKDFAEAGDYLGVGEPIKYYWPRTNAAGKQVAHGVYFAVLRFESTQGTKNICQTIKKILIP